MFSFPTAQLSRSLRFLLYLYSAYSIGNRLGSVFVSRFVGTILPGGAGAFILSPSPIQPLFVPNSSLPPTKPLVLNHRSFDWTRMADLLVPSPAYFIYLSPSTGILFQRTWQINSTTCNSFYTARLRSASVTTTNMRLTCCPPMSSPLLSSHTWSIVTFIPVSLPVIAT